MARGTTNRSSCTVIWGGAIYKNHVRLHLLKYYVQNKWSLLWKYIILIKYFWLYIQMFFNINISSPPSSHPEAIVFDISGDEESSCAVQCYSLVRWEVYVSNSKSQNAFCIISWGEIFEKHHSIYSGQITSLTVYQQMFDFHFFCVKTERGPVQENKHVCKFEMHMNGTADISLRSISTACSCSVTGMFICS